MPEKAGQRDLTMMDFAVELARAALRRDEIPIASVIADEDSVISVGLNQLVATGRLIVHAETTAIDCAGRRALGQMRSATLYTTLSACAMCTGAILLHRIPRVVVGDRTTFEGPTQLLRDNGVDVTFLDDPRAVEIMNEFREKHPDLWDEDNGGR